MIRILFFSSLLLLVLIFAWRWGKADERLAALTCLTGAVLTLLFRQSLATRFGSFDLAPFLIDAVVLLAFTLIALRSTRFWPMWVAGLQLTATCVHLIKLFSPDLMRFVFGAALAVWSYPILIIIALGAWRTQIVERWREELQLRECR